MNLVSEINAESMTQCVFGVKCQPAFNQNIIRSDSLRCQDRTVNVLEQLVKPFWANYCFCNIKKTVYGNSDRTVNALVNV